MSESTTIPTVLMLAGGIGNRFEPLTIDKTLLPLFGKPLIEHSLDQLVRVGIRKVVVVANPQNQAWLESYQHDQLSLTVVAQPEALGMGAAVLEAAPHLENTPLIIMNAIDQVADTLFFKLLEQSARQPFLIVGKQQKSYFPGGYLEIEANRVVSIVEKPPEGEQPSDLINLVFHYFETPHTFVELIKTTQSEQDDQYERALDQLLKQEKVGFIDYDEEWQAVKFPDMVLDVLSLALEHRLTSLESQKPTVATTATIEGNVVFGANVRVEAGAVIKGPAYIGDNVIVGTNSLVRQSSVEANSVVGFGSEVARSYVGPGCQLHHNFVGDSVLEGNCNPSWGTCFANWRFDNKTVTVHYPSFERQTNRTKLGAIVGDGAFFGINCSVMPGATVAANSIVFPNIRIKGAVTERCTESTF